MKNLNWCCFVLLIPLNALADTASIGSGFDYSSGKYGGSTTTDILYIPLTGKYEWDDLTLKLTLPYIRQTSTNDVVRGFGRIRKPTVQKVTTTEAGLGDVTAFADYTIYDGDSLTLDVYEGIKFGTASSSKGLGTGENDYSTELDGDYTINQSSIYWSAGYTVVGVPAGYQFRNVSYGSIGASQRIDDNTTIGLTYDASESASTLSENPSELTFDVSMKLDKETKVTTDISKGLSSGSPDFGFGLMVKNSF